MDGRREGWKKGGMEEMGDGGRKREREKQGDKGGNEECKKGERKRVKKEGTSDFVSRPSVHRDFS